MEHFYAYRIFLNQDSYKISFKNKKEAFLDIFSGLKIESEIKFYDYNEHVLLYVKEYGEHIHVLQLAKKQVFEKPILEEHKIEEVLDTRYPFIYVIVHTKRQMIFIEKNTMVFQTLDAVKSKLEKVFREQMSINNVVASLIEISDKREFWAQIDDFDIIEKVELEYEPPNFFGGKNTADKLVKEVHEETNFNKFKILLQNTTSGLKFQYENFKEHIQRISEGAGNYSIEGIKDGVKQWVTKNLRVPLRTDISNIEAENEESLEQRFREIDEINQDEDS